MLFRKYPQTYFAYFTSIMNKFYVDIFKHIFEFPDRSRGVSSSVDLLHLKELRAETY